MSMMLRSTSSAVTVSSDLCVSHAKAFCDLKLWTGSLFEEVSLTSLGLIVQRSQ
jgi:hypothetical protein